MLFSNVWRKVAIASSKHARSLSLTPRTANTNLLGVLRVVIGHSVTGIRFAGQMSPNSNSSEPTKRDLSSVIVVQKMLWCWSILSLLLSMVVALLWFGVLLAQKELECRIKMNGRFKAIDYHRTILVPHVRNSLITGLKLDEAVFQQDNAPQWWHVSALHVLGSPKKSYVFLLIQCQDV